MAKLNAAKLLVDNNSTGDIVEYLAEAMKANRTCAADAVDRQNIAKMGVALCNMQYIEAIIIFLNEKLNGKKEPTVVQ